MNNVNMYTIKKILSEIEEDQPEFGPISLLPYRSPYTKDIKEIEEWYVIKKLGGISQTWKITDPSMLTYLQFRCT